MVTCSAAALMAVRRLLPSPPLRLVRSPHGFSSAGVDVISSRRTPADRWASNATRSCGGCTAGDRGRADRADAYFVVEISVGIGVADVTRAAQRASLLAKLGRPTVAVVAGEWINSEAIAAADSYQVWQVLDGRTSPPGDA